MLTLAGNKYTSEDLERLNTSSEDCWSGGTFRNGNIFHWFEDATTIDQIIGEPDEGTFTEGGTYIPLDLKVQQQLMVIVQHK